MARWLASFSELACIVVIRETRAREWKRIRREVKRVGILRFADVVAMRFYYMARLARRDHAWTEQLLADLRRRFPSLPGATPTLVTPSPNTPAVEAFLGEHAPDLTIARCKVMLRPGVLGVPRDGTYVLHAGVCPEYRNAHGCFWALANGDIDKVGMTLLRIDAGVDTGPVYGYYSYPFDEVRESHMVIQQRVIFDNLDAIRDKLVEIHAGRAQAIDTTGRPSAAWGQPWLTRYLGWKRAARRRANP